MDIQLGLLADLSNRLPHAVRLQRLVVALREHFHCGAVGLLKLENDTLRPIAADGLVREAIGRRFEIGRHPRLAAIMSSRAPTRFEPGNPLPDPYDGLVDERHGEPLPVHDCMGISLNIEGRPWGVLTLDALHGNVFDEKARKDLQRYTFFIEAAVRVTELEEENQSLLMRRSDEAASSAEGVSSSSTIVGHSKVIRKLLQELDMVADSELPVLLMGETGVGKELFAQRLHQQSRRKSKPMVHVNCAALPESLAESELFGHVKGAFSGANAERPGRFEAADGGTLFLDEVGELPLSIQAKLLRVLQNGEIQRLGSDQTRHVDVRVIAATNRQLDKSVREGHFRADLYHRLSVYPVTIPPLRERENDVLEIAGNFLEQNRSRLGVRSLRLSSDSEQALLAYDWPGNVRELEHVISRAALRAASRGARHGEIITLEPEQLGLDIGHLPASAASGAMPATAHGHIPMLVFPSLKNAVESCQRETIRAALSQTSNNWAEAARLLKLDASNLHKLARRLGIK